MAIKTRCRRRADRRSVASGNPKVGGWGQWQAGRRVGGGSLGRQALVGWEWREWYAYNLCQLPHADRKRCVVLPSHEWFVLFWRFVCILSVLSACRCDENLACFECVVIWLWWCLITYGEQFCAKPLRVSVFTYISTSRNP